MLHMISRLRTEPNPLRFLLSRILAKTGLCRFFMIQCNGFKMHFHPAAVPMTLWSNVNALNEDTDFLRKFLRVDDCFVDVGANVGQLTLQAAVCIQNNKNIIAIEAHPDTYNYLVENLTLNDFSSIRAIHCAVGAEDGAVKFTSKRSDDQNEISSHGDIEVPIQRLDQLVELPNITLLKIDVEGFELYVLNGASRVLQNTQAIYFEAWDPLFAKYGYKFSDVVTVLSEGGFQLYSISGNILTPYISLSSQNHVNLLALKSEAFAIGRGFIISVHSQ